MSHVTNIINNYNDNQYKLIFNTWPNLTGKKLDMAVFENNIKSFTIPDINGPMLNTQIGHIKQLHPNPVGYRQLNAFHVTFAVDEKLLNYYAAKCWISGSRVGETKSNKIQPDDYLHYNRIETVELQNLDNTEKVVSRMLFKRVFLTNLGSLQLQFGQSNIATFTCTFEYEECDFEVLVDEAEMNEIHTEIDINNR